MRENGQADLTHDLILPTLLFAALGGMVWAIRGCSGFGAMNGCIFAGVTWGAGWWFIARDPSGMQSRRYASAWIILALTIGIGISGARGWMQWPSFFNGHLQTDAGKNEWVPISRAYGFLWLFIAGVPWAGIGACMLAWCGSKCPTRIWHWILRIACGVGGGYLATVLFLRFPEVFLPLYKSMHAQYDVFLDFLRAGKSMPKSGLPNPNLARLIGDCRSAIMHLGVFMGFLLFELGRRDWKNVTLISTVGLLNGLGWSLCQNWQWASRVWPGANFNFWRCWESSGGISIGIAYGLAYYLVNRRMSEEEKALQSKPLGGGRMSIEWLGIYLILLATLGFFALVQYGLTWAPIYLAIGIVFGIAYYVLNRKTPEETPLSGNDPNIERLALHLGLLVGLGLSIRNGLKGWFNIYVGNEDYWSGVLWMYLRPITFVFLVALVAWVLLRRFPRSFQGDVFPHAYGIVWLVLITQNLIAQLVTGPPTAWNEIVFSFYYVLLFLISAVIIYHFHFVKTRCPHAMSS